MSETRTHPPGRPALPRPAAALAAGLVVAPLLARLRLLRVRGFNPDELEHLHASWCVATGLVPYRDFFEHHTPGLYYLLAPLIGAFDVATEVGDAWAAIMAARQAMWAFTAAALVLTYLTGRLWRGPVTGGVAALLLGNAGIFLGKTLEIRPDVPAVALLTGSLLAFVAGERGARRRPWLFVASGALAGLAILMTQKALFVLPGMALAALLGAVQPRAGWRTALKTAGALALGVTLPIALCLTGFAIAGALPAFIEHNLLLNARWQHRLGPQGVAWELLRQDPALLLLGLAGLAGAAWRFRRQPVGTVAVAAWTASLIAGAFVIPVVQRQYALLGLPFLALCAASVVGEVWERAAVARPRAAAWGLAVVLLAASVAPALRLQAAFGRTNGGTLENIRFVLRNTSPSETVLDGFSGEGVFRPHAYRYFFLHEEIQQMLPAGEREALLASLRGGAVAPKVVLLDRHLKALSPELAAFVEQHYAPVGREPIRVRLFDNGVGRWDDQGWRRLAGPMAGPLDEPHLIVGEGWQKVEWRHGRLARTMRGRRSFLTLPVANPGAYRVLVRGGTAPGAPPVQVELMSGGDSLGEVTLAGWGEHEFPRPARRLRRGLNELVLLARGPGGEAGAGAAMEAVRLISQ